MLGFPLLFFTMPLAPGANMPFKLTHPALNGRRAAIYGAGLLFIVCASAILERHYMSDSKVASPPSCPQLTNTPSASTAPSHDCISSSGNLLKPVVLSDGQEVRFGGSFSGTGEITSVEMKNPQIYISIGRGNLGEYTIRGTVPTSTVPAQANVQSQADIDFFRKTIADSKFDEFLHNEFGPRYPAIHKMLGRLADGFKDGNRSIKLSQATNTERSGFAQARQHLVL
jgi:hypothetical protein